MKLFHIKKFRFFNKNENILTTKKSGFTVAILLNYPKIAKHKALQVNHK